MIISCREMIISNSSSLSLQPSARKNFNNWKKEKKKKKFNNINPNPSSFDDYLKGPSGSRRRRGTIVRVSSELAQDAPFVAAIGASVLTSLLIPVQEEEEEEEENGGGGVIDSTDARFAVMGIIAFIPYFNWMSWVFAWLDTGKQRYLAYAVVYLAPYFRSNFSISPDESWLPIASILLCILHIQLEASIRNGDLKFPSLFSPLIGKEEDTHFQNHQGLPKKGKSKEQVELPSAHNKREDFKDWGIPRKPDNDLHRSKETPDVNAEESKLD